VPVGGQPWRGSVVAVRRPCPTATSRRRKSCGRCGRFVRKAARLRILKFILFFPLLILRFDFCDLGVARFLPGFLPSVAPLALVAARDAAGDIPKMMLDSVLFIFLAFLMTSPLLLHIAQDAGAQVLSMEGSRTLSAAHAAPLRPSFF
jgi:hypothetical protein